MFVFQGYKWLDHVGLDVWRGEYCVELGKPCVVPPALMDRARLLASFELCQDCRNQSLSF